MFSVQLNQYEFWFLPICLCKIQFLTNTLMETDSAKRKISAWVRFCNGCCVEEK